MEQTQTHFDAIVIGSGIGGLCAALTLARDDRSVLVLEAGKQFGGYINPFKRGKYGFDPGLHYIGECGENQSFDRMLRSLGIRDQIEFRELSPDCIDRLAFPGYSVDMPRGIDAYHQRLANDFPHERTGLEKFFSYLQQFHNIATLFADKPRVRPFIGAVRHVPFLLRYGRATFGTMLDDLFRDPLLKSVLAAQGGDYAMPPSRASAMIGLGVLDHYLGGAYFPVGGSRALRDVLVKNLEALGAEMHRNAPVSKVIVRDGVVRGVQTREGKSYTCDVVVSNADAAYTYESLIGPEHLSSRVHNRARNTRQSLASICMFIGTDLDVAAAGMTDRNIWHYSDVDIEKFYTPMFAGKIPDGEFFFLSSPSLKDPEKHLAPPGHHTLELVTLCPYEPFEQWAGTHTMKRGESYEEFKDKLAQRFLNGIERYVPGIKQHIRVMEVATPLTNVSFAASPRGAIYGPEHSPEQMGPFRYSVRGAIPGLFFAGSSTLGAGVVPAGLSGYVSGRAAREAIRPRKHRVRVSRDLQEERIGNELQELETTLAQERKRLGDA